MPAVDLDSTGGRGPTCWREAGAGRPVVLVHGWALSARAFEPVIPELARHGRVLALDLRGHGDAPAAPPGHRIAGHARDLAALFDARGLERALLVGWSMGAQVALEALPLLGGRVAGLALLSVTPCFTEREGWPHGLPAASVRALAARVRHRPELALRRFFDGMFAPDELPAPERDALAVAVLSAPFSQEAALAGLEALLAADQRPRLSGVRVPTLLVHGERDPICLPAASAFMAEAIPSARRWVLPGVGHAPQLSRPALVSELLARHLSGLP
jgi:pimeloyl-ACP methyl ester carboxylesterase